MDQIQIKSFLKERLPYVGKDKKVALEITGGCPGRCFFCYAKFLRKISPMKLEDVKQTLSTIKQTGYTHVYIVGGEPMVHGEIQEILKYSFSLNLYTILVSNGFTLDKKRAAENIAPHVHQVEISLRSPKENIHNRIVSGHGIYEEIVAAADCPGNHKSALNALKNLTEINSKSKRKIKLIVNHDLYRDRDFKASSKGSVYELAKITNENNITLDGIYLQLVYISNQVKTGYPNSLNDIQISKMDLLKALSDLRNIERDFNIKDLRLVDDPKINNLVESINEIPNKYKKFLITEYIPAICNSGVKPNVIEDPILVF